MSGMSSAWDVVVHGTGPSNSWCGMRLLDKGSEMKVVSFLVVCAGVCQFVPVWLSCLTLQDLLSSCRA